MAQLTRSFVSRVCFAFIGAAVAAISATGAEWQWSVPVGSGRAFLWIPPNCQQVRAVIVGQHNMIEQGIFEHATMRQTLATLGIAEVFIAPPFDRPFNFDKGAGERFNAIINALAEESGYTELATAPVVPMGHSACASFPWNFAAWNPSRTLAILSIKGDAPQTNLTGSGAPNPDWKDRRIDGIPGLMVMSEYEWWDARLTPALKFHAANPGAPIALLADTGHGHFDATDPLVEFLALFIRKASEARLPPANDTDGALKYVDPKHGWLVDRWRGNEPLHAPTAPMANYAGNRTEAFWCFDEETARATEAYYTTNRAKKNQQVDFVQKGELTPISTTHTGVQLKFLPLADGISFRLTGNFIAPLPPKPPVAAKDKPPTPTTIKPVRADPGTHASGSVVISRIVGPVEQLTPDIFRIAFNRNYSTVDDRNHDIWLLARHPGDGQFKSAVQQALLKLKPNTTGVAQTISFPQILAQKTGITSLRLNATSDANVSVSYYVREGPAEVEGDTLRFTQLPPRAKLPVKITVVAWQWGRSTEPKLSAAVPVERTFELVP